MPNYSKGDIDSPVDTVVFVGNGAINNGSAPLRRALDKWINNGPNDPIVQKLRKKDIEAFHQLAVLSYKFRFFRALLFKKHLTNANTCIEGSIRQMINHHNSLSGFLSLRQDICNEFAQDNTLSPRFDPKIQEIIGDNALFVTTNWDSSLWNCPQVKKLIHLHGRDCLAESMVFPTELLIEDTVFDLAPVLSQLQGFSRATLDQVIEIFRYNCMQDLFNGYVSASNQLASTKKVVIWGYSLGDYDADINSIIGTWPSRTDNELWVINPSSDVFKRSIALTACPNARQYHPIEKIEYNLRDA